METEIRDLDVLTETIEFVVVVQDDVVTDSGDVDAEQRGGF